MKTCKDSIHALLEYLDGDMSADEARELEAHLNGCSPCVEFVRTYRETTGLCKRALAAKMPSEVADRLKGFLQSKLKK